jgi:hypothetical protein
LSVDHVLPTFCKLWNAINLSLSYSVNYTVNGSWVVHEVQALWFECQLLRYILAVCGPRSIDPCIWQWYVTLFEAELNYSAIQCCFWVVSYHIWYNVWHVIWFTVLCSMLTREFLQWLVSHTSDMATITILLPYSTFTDKG